jgi:hypothetical protein
VEADLTIADAGLTGLTAAVDAAEQDWRVTVVEARAGSGRRARPLPALGARAAAARRAVRVIRPGAPARTARPAGLRASESRPFTCARVLTGDPGTAPGGNGISIIKLGRARAPGRGCQRSRDRPAVFRAGAASPVIVGTRGSPSTCAHAPAAVAG